MAPVSETALEKAKNLILVDEMPDVSTSEVCDRVRTTESVSGFVSASGRKLAPVSETALEKAKNLILVDEMPDVSTSEVCDRVRTTGPVSGRNCTAVSENDFKKAETLNGVCEMFGENKAVVSNASLVSDQQGAVQEFVQLSACIDENDSTAGCETDGDSLVCLMEETQLEAKRLQARLEQQETISRKLRLSSPSRRKSNIPNDTFSLHCPGLLWRVRLSKRQLTKISPTAVNDRACGPWLYSLQSLVRKPDHGPAKSEFQLPDSVHFPADFSTFSLRTSATIRWLLDEPNLPVGEPPIAYEIGDAVQVIPDGFGCAGKTELIK
ncbi:unnamed protein product [Echinostoma caproni]|uniref:Uncharacterized protein n=1 Tax=Echinostoma caproni TaxID=27848 RepID=A0A3P8LER2_9TREM|nr:unnamed protein product [Echinostoma caproni]